MSVTTRTMPALIERRGGKLFWLCPNCRRTLGELVGIRLVVIIGDRVLTFGLEVGSTQTCPKCGIESVLDSLSN